MEGTFVSSAPGAVGFREALRFWFKLGCISFGGPAGQIAIMHRELVERRHWISERRFLHALNYCMVLPGPEAQQLATYIGWLLHGTRGGIAAGALFVLPSLLLLVALSWIYVRFGEVPFVRALLEGVKPAVVAIVLAAAWRIGTRTIRSLPLAAIALAAFVALAVFAAPFPAVVAVAALLGWIGSRFVPSAFAPPSHSAPGAAPHVPAVIDDDTPSPEHARFSRGRLAGIVLVFLALWAATLGVLAFAFGWHGDFSRMAVFFTQAALLTFGGAYAVLPYVVQGAVEQYGWLGAAQMIDGLALGETTPGPLIMVVAFVGFLGGWTKGLLGSGALFAAGALGATIATWFTFLPSFLFILAGGPLVEGTRNDARLTAPLTAITAAVVGVIVSLAVYFGAHVFWKPAGFDVVSAMIAAAALLALTRYRVGVIPVIASSGLAGLAAWVQRGL
ncbi:chromate transporter [Betaproteobacteria bacterium GR16-43]|nr:chromate transporter [Betaproteobacteria bacterium GR16-43]